MIKTKNEIEIVIDPIKKTTASALLFGKMFDPTWRENYTKLSMSYIYFRLDENNEEVMVSSGFHIWDTDQINNMDINEEYNKKDKCNYERKLHYNAFKILMSENYSIPLDQIEII